MTDSYGYLADPAEPELYEGAREELNVRSASSLLYRLSLQLYQTMYANEPGGQQLAVADALSRILRKRNVSSSSKSSDKLKRALVKERRKNSPPGKRASGDEDDSPKHPKTDAERLDDYIAQRKQINQGMISPVAKR